MIIVLKGQFFIALSLFFTDYSSNFPFSFLAVLVIYFYLLFHFFRDFIEGRLDNPKAKWPINLRQGGRRRMREMTKKKVRDRKDEEEEESEEAKEVEEEEEEVEEEAEEAG